MAAILNYVKMYRIPAQAFFLYCWLVNLKDTDAYYSVYLLTAAAACFAMHKNYQNNPPIDRNTEIKVLLFSGVFSVAIVLANYSLFQPWAAMQNIFESACTLIGGWVSFFHIVLYLISALPLPVSDRKTNHPIGVFFGSFILFSVVFLCHLFFRIYPGILTLDSLSTINQILTGEYNNTMPFWHTVTIQVFFDLGMVLFGEINAAIALVHTVQSLFIAACFAYTVVTLYQLAIPSLVIGVVALGYAIMPYHIVYSVTLWKDVLFGGAALLMVVALLRILTNVGKSSAWNCVVFAIGSVGLCLWRTNGLLAFGMLTLVMVLVCGKKYKRLLFIMGIILLVCWILVNPLLTAFNVPGTNFVEALAIPFQQVSRVVASDLPLTEEETRMLSEVFLLDLVKEKYDPLTVDPIKFETMKHSTPLLEDPIGYLLLWIKLGFRYPGVYLEAWIDETKGYWNAGYEFSGYIPIKCPRIPWESDPSREKIGLAPSLRQLSDTLKSSRYFNLCTVLACRYG